MLSALISWWRNWRFRRRFRNTEHTLKVLRKMHQDEDEFVRLVALVSILKLDPTKRDELMPLIQTAQGSENQVVSDLAEEFMTGKKHRILA